MTISASDRAKATILNRYSGDSDVRVEAAGNGKFNILYRVGNIREAPEFGVIFSGNLLSIYTLLSECHENGIEALVIRMATNR